MTEVMKRGWISFDWERLTYMGSEFLHLGNRWFGHVVNSPDDGGYYGTAAHCEQGRKDITGEIETSIFSTAQEAGDDLLKLVRATFPMA